MSSAFQVALIFARKASRSSALIRTGSSALPDCSAGALDDAPAVLSGSGALADVAESPAVGSAPSSASTISSPAVCAVGGDNLSANWSKLDGSCMGVDTCDRALTSITSSASSLLNSPMTTSGQLVRISHMAERYFSIRSVIFGHRLVSLPLRSFLLHQPMSLAVRTLTVSSTSSPVSAITAEAVQARVSPLPDMR